MPLHGSGGRGGCGSGAARFFSAMRHTTGSQSGGDSWSGAEFDRGSLGGRRAGLSSMMQHDDGRDFGLQFTTGKRATDMNGAQERRRRPLCPSRSGRGRDSISDGAARWAGMELGGVAVFGCEPVSWRGRAQECVEGSL